MPPRSSWKGYIKLSLVSVPVKAYTATSSAGGGIHLNQLHADCNSRINYKKFCPVHGEVTSDAIVSGYEYAKGQYVVVDPDELDKLLTEDDKAVAIDTFIRPDAIDPIYETGKTYYLVPDGPVAQKPYAVLLAGMVDLDRNAIAQVVMHGKEQLVLLRPYDGLLTMTTLYRKPEITEPSTFEGEVIKPVVEPEELKLAKTLIEASTAKKIDYDKYQDEYTHKLTQLIEAKVAGKEIVTPPVHEQAQIINLMDALRQSVAKATKAAPEPAAKAAPTKKMAPSVRKTRERKQKSG